jgi:RND family efflux transporter MFP subunit
MTSLSVTGAGLCAALALSACGDGNQYVAPPPPKVTVAVPVQQQVTRYLEVTGNMAAVNSADLVARVSGFLQSVNYQDGAQVKQGTLLFTIEPEPYKVKLEQAKAAEAGADAVVKQNQSTLQRQSELLQKQNTSQASYDQALASRDSAQASLDQAKANTATAQINYEYANVAAPFDGTVTARQVSVGQYVGGTGTPTVLATIVQHSPIYVNFNVSEKDVLDIRATLAARGIRTSDLNGIAVEVGLQNENGYPHQGKLNYVAPTVDQTTGTLMARAILDNADAALLPGYFVRVRIPRGAPASALLVPEAALGSDQGGRYVLVVNKDNVVEQRKVAIGPQEGTSRVIESGIAPGDRIVVNGMQRAIPGQKIDPQEQPAADRH